MAWRELPSGLLVPDTLELEAPPDQARDYIAGLCRRCGCTEDDPCLLEGADAGLDDFCAWADPTHTLCTGCAS